MWPRFKSQKQRHMWVRFVVRSSDGIPVFLSSNQHFHSNKTWEMVERSQSVDSLRLFIYLCMYVFYLLFVYLFTYLFIYEISKVPLS